MSFYPSSAQGQPYNGSMGGPPVQSNPNAPPDYLRFQYPTMAMSPQMLDLGLSTGQDLLSKQRDKWMPGIFGFWLSLKYYFAVSNSYVLKKLSVLLYPLGNKAWARVPADEFERGESDQISHKWALPKQDFNAPDLYLPVMAFVSYILLCGLDRGLHAGSGTFSPDLIIQATWRCLALQTVEVCAAKFALSLLLVNISFLDVSAYAGYKYVPLCLNLLARMLHSSLNVLVSLYTAGMLGFFMLKTLAAAVPPASAPSGTASTQRFIILMAIGASQLVLVLIMSML